MNRLQALVRFAIRSQRAEFRADMRAEDARNLAESLAEAAAIADKIKPGQSWAAELVEDA